MIPFPSLHTFFFSSCSTIIPLTFSCVCLSPSFSLILICFPPSVCHIRPGISTSSTLSNFSPLSVFLSLLLYFSSAVLLLCHATQLSLPCTSPPLPLYFLTSKSLLSRLHRFLHCFSFSLSLPPSPSLPLFAPPLFLEADVVCQILSLLAN